MPNLPKPPKFYYFIAGAALFITIFSLFIYGKYTFDKNLKQTYVTIPIYKKSFLNDPKNALPVESGYEFNQDSNLDTVKSDPCLVSIKLNQSQNIKVHSKTISKNDKTHVIALSISADISIDGRNIRTPVVVICTQNPIITEGDVSYAYSEPNFTEDLSDELGRVVGLDLYSFFNKNPNYSYGTFSENGFSYNYDLYTKPKDIYPKLITSIKSEHPFESKLRYTEMIDLDEVSKGETQKQFLNQDKKIVVVGCDKYLKEDLDEDICKIWNTQKKQFFNLKDFSAEFVFEGKSIDGNNYVVFRSSDNCKDKLKVYNFDTQSNQLIDLNKTIDVNYCISIEQGTLLDVNCPKENIGEEAAKCFKKDSDYQTYLRDYKEEQAKNKSAQSELAKYLE